MINILSNVTLQYYLISSQKVYYFINSLLKTLSISITYRRALQTPIFPLPDSDLSMVLFF